MDIGALLTSAAINTGLSVLLFSLYSILRKQPSNTIVYFGRRLASLNNRNSRNHFSFERFVPSPSWIVKAWETTENEILAIGGLDAVVFQRILVFSCYVSVPGASSELLWAGDETQAYPCRVPQCIYNCKCERRLQMALGTLSRIIYHILLSLCSSLL